MMRFFREDRDDAEDLVEPWTLERTLCGVLDEMRTAHKTRNYSYLVGLIEEAQLMGNRMEAGLRNIKSYEELTTKISRAKKILRALKVRIADATPKPEKPDA